MSPPVRVQLPCPEPGWLIEITDDESRTLIRRDSDVSYHSRCGAAAECDHVYLSNGGCSIGETSDETSRWPTTILEVGLGTGMSMLRTLDRMVANDRPLRYIGIDRHPLMSETLEQLDLARGLQKPELATKFLRWYSESRAAISIIPAVETGSVLPLRWSPTERHVVDYLVGDVLDWITGAEVTVDTVYFDVFDPKTNPEVWEISFLRELVKRIKPGGRLVTYCVASEIRRRMEAAGLEVRRVPGPRGGKREVMIAVRPEFPDHARG
ncbi:tRNA (5-methylaminomethyl-2-thiouridine)(34)-methyltransferase MnmD [Aporhodopirellula aestuarii]|uniref:tRNA (5-methylaminomethyl-2-thiouridine)(34)-methyltransferase MnmD n=1 Tax=Aporhodopirellula aestuarii TaxID=2950107 RepID=A0ABT0U953_9BACT|nr:tRNA (5-methylaminomethyl-2-thiouridine)(34)-methyltransferase MnmD [Aporhodopirellula aestuarii]MCM2373504.1 tRNA (5-methylaminomethyl-2-thiouridine)(34)-methyltransferase MnmD [Aporhodopirellula aestuarii]